MWRLKLAYGVVLCFFTLMAQADYYYTDVAEPSINQIVASPTSIGGHSPDAAAMCDENDPLWCYSSKDFSFAIPRGNFIAQEWRRQDYLYSVLRRTRIAILGNDLELVEILQRRNGKETMRFVYSMERGLISFRAVGPNVRSFILENRCGLAAPTNCND